MANRRGYDANHLPAYLEQAYLPPLIFRDVPPVGKTGEPWGRMDELSCDPRFPRVLKKVIQIAPLALENAVRVCTSRLLPLTIVPRR